MESQSHIWTIRHYRKLFGASGLSWDLISLTEVRAVDFSVCLVFYLLLAQNVTSKLFICWTSVLRFRLFRLITWISLISTDKLLLLWHACVHTQSLMSDSVAPWTVALHQEEWAAISSFRGSSHPRGQTHVSCVSCIGACILHHIASSKSKLCTSSSKPSLCPRPWSTAVIQPPQNLCNC